MGKHHDNGPVLNKNSTLDIQQNRKNLIYPQKNLRIFFSKEDVIEVKGWDKKTAVNDLKLLNNEFAFK